MPCIIYRVGSLKNRRLNLNYALWQREPRTKRFKFYKRRRTPCCRAARLAVATPKQKRSGAFNWLFLSFLSFSSIPRRKKELAANGSLQFLRRSSPKRALCSYSFILVRSPLRDCLLHACARTLRANMCSLRHSIPKFVFFFFSRVRRCASTDLHVMLICLI